MLFLQQIVVAILSLSALGVAQKPNDRSITIYAWPMTASFPQELARITYNEAPLSKPTISDFKSPPVSPSQTGKDSEDLVRVGLYDPSTQEWRGVVTSLSSFDPKYQQLLSLHVDLDWAPWHVGFSAHPMPSPTPDGRRKGENLEAVPQVITEVVTPNPGPTPHLNRPVVLSPDGKVENKEVEKTFLQKYWWAIAIFLAIQVMSSAGGGGGAAEK